MRLFESEFRLHLDPSLGNDPRLVKLTEWVRSVLPRETLRISVASADASFRRYFRASGTGRNSWIVMDAPPEHENVRPFIAVANMLVAADVNAPKILEQNKSDGFLLLSDLGDRTYLSELANENRADPLYGDAIAALVRMQAGCASNAVAELPPYDAALLRREVELFPDWLLSRHLGIEVDAASRRTLDETFSFLIDAALGQPRVFVHRDYHSRNLMVTDGALHGPNPGVLDFQDAVFGPITYDLVSLLRDCYIAWPVDRVHGWLRAYRSAATTAGVDVGSSEAQFIRWFDLMGIQRHLKASGIFARLWHRDGKRGYLKDIPRTVGYIDAAIRPYPELNGFARLFAQWLPALSTAS